MGQETERLILDAMIRNTAKAIIRLGSARHLMDDDLFEVALSFRDKGGAQYVWDAYCSMHGMRHDAFFEPDLDLFWDTGMTQEEKMKALGEIMWEPSFLESIREWSYRSSSDEPAISGSEGANSPNEPKP